MRTIFSFVGGSSESVANWHNVFPNLLRCDAYMNFFSSILSSLILSCLLSSNASAQVKSPAKPSVHKPEKITIQSFGKKIGTWERITTSTGKEILLAGVPPATVKVFQECAVADVERKKIDAAISDETKRTRTLLAATGDINATPVIESQNKVIALKNSRLALEDAIKPAVAEKQKASRITIINTGKIYSGLEIWNTSNP